MEYLGTREFIAIETYLNDHIVNSSGYWSTITKPKLGGNFQNIKRVKRGKNTGENKL